MSMEIEYRSVADFGEIITGKTPSTSVDEFWSGEIPFITPTDIVGYDMRYIFSTERQITDEGANSQINTILPKNTICVSCIASIGKMCITSAAQSITNQQINSIVVKKGYDYQYLFYLLRYFLPYIQLIGGGTGSGTPIISKTKFSKLKYPVCVDKAIQARIAVILSTYDSLIEVNNKRIKVLEQMAENLYKEWFVRFRFPGHETAEFENGIPKRWAYRRADEVIDFNPTLKTGSQTEFTIIPMEALSTNSMVLDSSCFVRQDSISGRRSQNGDTLLAKITPCLENGKTGFVMGMPENEVLGGSTEFVVMRSKALTPHYVYCIARSYYFRQTAILSMNGADGRQRVDEEKLKSTKIVQPEKTVLDRFETIVTPIFDGVYQMVQENKNLMKQRDLLLPRLMSGKLEV